MALNYERKINPEDDLGFGYQPVIKNQPLINKDGSPNVRRKGLNSFNISDNYHKLVTMSLGKFFLLVLITYFIINVVFALIYMIIDQHGLYGINDDTGLNHFWEAFFFSTQTITTVGYGHIYPKGMAANSVAAFESMLGLLSFAMATGLLYGRFSKPSEKIIYSKNIIVAPYKDNGRGLMFRLANSRTNILVDLNIDIMFSYNVEVDGQLIRRFFPLELERKTVSMLTLNWTVVHPLDENSPLNGMTLADLKKSEAGFAVMLKTFDDAFSQTVHSRTAYMTEEIIWGAKFKPIFDRDREGRILLDLGKINDYELVALPDCEQGCF
jgi:inward rectifier potassium channel